LSSAYPGGRDEPLVVSLAPVKYEGPDGRIHE
jgi:hypothetical protein